MIKGNLCRIVSAVEVRSSIQIPLGCQVGENSQGGGVYRRQDNNHEYGFVLCYPKQQVREEIKMVTMI